MGAGRGIDRLRLLAFELGGVAKPMTHASTAPITETTYARVGLLGNPSDGYGGKAIAVSLYDFAAHVTIAPAKKIRLQPSADPTLGFDSIVEAGAICKDAASNGGVRLLSAAVSRFRSFAGQVDLLPAHDPKLRFSIEFETTIPLQVGLAGSSAIVIAALRSLASWFGVEISRFELAELALQAELEDLGNAAGPMDRVIQSYEGLLAMEFCEPRTEQGYLRLDADCLPPLFVAWRPGGGDVSGKPHGDLRTRWLAGDARVMETVEELRGVVDRGIACLATRDHDEFRRLVDNNFELRTRIFDVGARDHEMIALAREHHAAAKLCGSGGAILGVPRKANDLERIGRAFVDRGFEFLVPRLTPFGGSSS